MSIQHPIIAVTGSSGAGTTTTSQALRHIFRSLNVHAAMVEGDSFHRYSRTETEVAIIKTSEQGGHISYFGPEANDVHQLEALFKMYGASETGETRRYFHSFDDAVPYNHVPGPFTP